MVALAVITGTLWFGISYGSPCAPLPPPEVQQILYPEPLPSNIVVFINYNNFPQLWCGPGEYSLYGEVRPLPADPAPTAPAIEHCALYRCSTSPSLWR